MPRIFRPARFAPAPQPFYASPTTLYCHACGRVISSKRPSPADARRMRAPMYCSARCKRNKPGRLERRIESAFVAALELDVSVLDVSALDTPVTGTVADSGHEGIREKMGERLRQRMEELVSRKREISGRKKGDKRVLVACGEVQAVIFGDGTEEAEGKGGKGVGGEEGEEEEEEHDDDDEDDEDDDDDEGEDAGGVSLHMNGQGQNNDTSNGASNGEATDLDLDAKQQHGMKRARQKEMVKQAARRLVVFGYKPQSQQQQPQQQQAQPSGSKDSQDEQQAKRLCEAVVNGKVVEPSFAKGDWSVRWRDD